MKNQTIVINGTAYDSQTGEIVQTNRQQQSAVQHGAYDMHSHLQKSTTLNRRYVHRVDEAAKVKATQPVAVTAASIHQTVQTITTYRRPMTAPTSMSGIKRSSQINRFAPKPVTARTPIVISAPDIEPATHPMVAKAVERTQQTNLKRAKQAAPRQIKPSDIIKREAIEQATAKMPSKYAKKRAPKRAQRSYFARFLSIGSASLAVLMLGAYFTYLSMPSLSTRVAAAQAGINASYPGYHPMGYSLNGPVAYQEGKVSMKFAANGGPESYTLSQTKSAWDSTALLE